MYLWQLLFAVPQPCIFATHNLLEVRILYIPRMNTGQTLKGPFVFVLCPRFTMWCKLMSQKLVTQANSVDLHCSIRPRALPVYSAFNELHFWRLWGQGCSKIEFCCASLFCNLCCTLIMLLYCVRQVCMMFVIGRGRGGRRLVRQFCLPFVSALGQRLFVCCCLNKDSI